ncbi:MAG TPA: alpha-amylase family glycosyl hydrolase [Gemmatimonadales bacterium]
MSRQLPLALLAAALAGPLAAQATLTLSAPASTPAGATIYVAGSFNQWNPAAPGFRLTRGTDGRYAITLPADVRGAIAFKFTLGSWDAAELDSAGHDAPNRTFTVPATGAATYDGTVPAWRDGSPRPALPASATASVRVLSDDFAMPELGRTRRVWLYLPPGYATSGRRYPVLYMHDGQNVFDARTSFAGEWGVDETLDSLHALGDSGVIVVAVDNGQAKRLDEYSPWRNAKDGGGEGAAYTEFLVRTLKPYIDAHYRTRPDRLHTGVAGSSMGGLISLYALLTYPDVFGRAGVFSPAFWFAPEIYALARRAHPRPGTRIYLVAGGNEGDTPQVYADDLRRMADTLAAAGFALGGDLRATIRPDGRHAEWFWRREFPQAYRWLFQEGPAWTRGGTCYEIFVRSFFDSNGDGIGDLNGVTAKLGYVDSLGADCIWLMPVMASPSYHGYDVRDYYTVEPAYGTNADFQRLTAEAHRRGIRVLVDLVLNHTSSEHPHFQEALRDTASPYRAWYRFSPTPLGKGPWGEDAWRRSPVRDEYYWGVFSRGMPDLNDDTPAVREEAKKIATFWLTEMGADGFRLDAVPYLVEEGSCLMGCAGTHAVLRAFAAHVDSVKPGAYTVGEAWGNIDAVLPYYPDQLTSYFGFALADSLLAAERTGHAAGLLAGYLRLQDTLPAWRWSPFLSNHDQTRVMTALGGDIAKARQAATLLLTLPGFPFIYYGEEIGMTGDKPDPRIRTPMQWSPRAGLGFTTGTPWETPQADSLTTTVAAQDANPGSLLNLYRRLIHLRRNADALGAGTLVALTPSSSQVAAYLRRAGTHAVLVVANVGTTPAAGVTIGSEPYALPAGRYAARNLLGGPDGLTLRVGADGQVRRYVPLRRALAPHETLVLELTSR